MSKRRSSVSILIVLLSGMLFVSGCSIKLPKLFSKVVPISNLPAEALFIDRNEIYTQTLSLIQSARTSIYVEQAVFDDPRLIQLLLDKSRAGLDVRILLDQWQTVNRTTLDQLKSQNVSIQFYPAQKGQISHTKFLVVDQTHAFIYGPSWTANGFQAHDLAVELSGKSAWKVASQFAIDWENTTTLHMNVAKTSTLPEDNITIATNANVKQQISEQITSSTQSICLENSEISDSDLVQALIDAAEKGRDIRLILDQTATSSMPATINTLKAKGIQIRYFPTKPSLGMHFAILDNRTFILSSSGWTHYIFNADHEFSITVPSPAATTKLLNLFNHDWKISTP